MRASRAPDGGSGAQVSSLRSCPPATRPNLRLCVRINNVILLAAAVWFLLAPAVLTLRRCADPALRHPGRAPAFAWPCHRALTAELPRWADARVASGVAGHLNRAFVPDTEWPIFTCVFYLTATEALQREWVRDHPADAPDAPAVYSRNAIRAAAALVADPVHHTWVREHWGANYLHTEDVFFRSLLIATFTHYEALTRDHRYHDQLVDQARTLADDLDQSEYGVLEDYPAECYPIDVLAAIGWIRDSDRITGLDHAPFAARARRAFEGRLADHGLPAFRINRRTLQLEDLTRGTGNSWSMVFAPALWPEQAQVWMARYERLFWQERFGARGFREYANTVTARDWGFDIDAGPIFGGFSPAANAFAIGGMRAAGRYDLAWPIAAQTITAGWPLLHGRFGTAQLLSSQAHAPLLGEAALLALFTMEPAPGVTIRAGHGLPPPIVFCGLCLYLLAFALMVRGLRRRARGWHDPNRGAAAPFPRLQIGLWIALMAAGAGLWFAGLIAAAGLAVLTAQLLPMRARRPPFRRSVSSAMSTCPRPDKSCQKNRLRPVPPR